MKSAGSHEERVSELWGDFNRGENDRVPVTFACDEQLWLKIAGHSFREFYQKFVLPCHERLYSTMTTGERRIHLCGHAAQHFPALHQDLGVTAIDGPGPFVDHAECFDTLGPDFSFAAQMDHSVLANGATEDIHRMMSGLLTPGAKRPGRFQILGYVTARTPLENIREAYLAAEIFGEIETI